MRKKAQASGGAAAALIGIITLLLIFYIVFLPPEDRARLLSDDDFESPDSVTGFDENVLIDESIGQLNYVPETTVPHLMPNILLQEMRDAMILEEMNPFMISKGVVGKKDKIIAFKLTDYEHTENVLLTFKTPIHEGVLKISFNGFEIFESDVTTTSLDPIKIRDEYLQETNTIVFSVEGFGFPTKEYSFENMKIIGDLIDADRLHAIETIPLRSFEYSNLDTAMLEYFSVCNQFNVGNLEILVNGNQLFSGVPSCDGVNRQDLDKQDLQEGKNIFEFKIKEGSMRLELMKLKTYLKPSSRFTDFYKIDDILMEDIGTGKKKIILEIQFLDDGRRKKAKTNVNSEYDIIDQTDSLFRRDISSIVVRGNNFLELTPMTDLYISKIQVRIE